MVPAPKDDLDQEEAAPAGPELPDLVVAAAAELLRIVDGFRHMEAELAA